MAGEPRDMESRKPEEFYRLAGTSLGSGQWGSKHLFGRMILSEKSATPAFAGAGFFGIMP
jgi:hypothetical protein